MPDFEIFYPSQPISNFPKWPFGRFILRFSSSKRLRQFITYFLCSSRDPLLKIKMSSKNNMNSLDQLGCGPWLFEILQAYLSARKFLFDICKCRSCHHK